MADGALFAHGYTFGGHPLSCAVALANLDIMERLGVVENVRATEGYLEAALNDVAARSPIAVEARGAGFFRAIELVSNDHVLRARDAIRAQGAIVRADVRVNPCLAISPPLICDRGHVEELAAAVSAGLEAVA
jgi:adenosylmethionine-8-amino-7-oxononanoate aminotransferase